MVARCAAWSGKAGASAAASCAPVEGTGGAVAGSSSGNSSDGQMTPTAALLDFGVAELIGEQAEHRLVEVAGGVDAVVPAVRQHEQVGDAAGGRRRRQPAVAVPVVGSGCRRR